MELYVQFELTGATTSSMVIHSYPDLLLVTVLEAPTLLVVPCVATPVADRATTSANGLSAREFNETVEVVRG